MAIFQLPKQLHTDFARPNIKPNGAVELDKDNSISKDLYHSIILDSFAPTDLAGNATKDQITVTGSNVSLGVDNVGKTLLWNRSDSNQLDIDNGDFHNDADGSYTVAHTFRIEGTPSSTTPHMLSTVGPSLGNNNSAYAVVSIEDGKAHTFLVTRDKDNIIAYLDGKEIASSPSIANRASAHFFRYHSNTNTLYGYFGDGTANQLMIGGSPHTSNQRWDGAIYMSSFWRRALTPAEGIAYSRNPYQILKPKSPQLYFTEEGAATPTIAAAATSYTATTYNPSLSPGVVTLSPSLVSETASVPTPSVSAAVATLAAAALSESVSVLSVSLQAGSVTLSPDVVSATQTIQQNTLSSISILSPDLTTSSVQTNNTSVSLSYNLAVNALSYAALVQQPALPYEQFISPAALSNTALVEQPRVLTGDVLSPNVVTKVVNVASVSTQSGSVTILPLLLALDTNVYRVRLFDPSDTVNGFYSNDTMIEYFRQQTGLDSYQFNELAKAYYEQVAVTNDAAFNESLIAAQLAAGFIGLAPTDWRNF